MFAGIDRGFEVQRAETRWSRQDNDIAILFQNFRVSIEPDELTIFRDVNLITVLTLQLANSALQIVIECIGYGDQLRWAGCVHRLVRSTSTSTTTADQTDANRFVAVHVSRADRAEVCQDRRSSRSDCGGLQKASP
jgi:hypothetical protein